MSDLRNVALLSHSGAGKTAVTEAMLHHAKVINRLGKIEDGTTTSDFEEEEVKRQSSVQLSLMKCPWNGTKINILDAPGYADFRGEVVSVMHVADSAVMVVSAAAGVEVGTQQMWHAADERGMPRLVFVNKMDRENADFQRAMDALVDAFGRKCVATHLPIGAEAEFSRVISVLDESADVPDEMTAQVEAAREALVEAAAEADDSLTEKYLEGETLTSDEIINGLKQRVATGDIVPVLVGSATAEIGVSELMDAIVGMLPSPSQVAPVSAEGGPDGDEAPLPCDPSGPLAAFTFKTSADPFVGKLSYLKIYSGTLKADSQVWNSNKNEQERIGQLFEVTGKTQDAVSQLEAGDIGAVAKLNSVVTGDTLATKERPLVLGGMQFPSPVYLVSVYPSSKADLDKMTSSLARIGEEDPSLVISRDPDTLELLLGGLGDTHVEVAAEKMKRKFGVEIDLHQPIVPYKETIVGAAKVEYRHKKQTGGHGQFGHVWLEVQPLPRGEGFEFTQKVVGGSVPREYIPAVEKGARNALTDGVIAGFPVVDLKATLVDGSFHPVDSSGISFEIAGNHALSKGINAASPVLLEPVLRVEITVPDNYAGDIIGDLNSKRAKIQGMVPQGNGNTVIQAEAPQAEMIRYATDLRSQTQGRGTFTVEFDHYEEVPNHLVERVVAEVQERAKEREEAKA